MQKPLFYAKAAVETMMRKFEAPELPPVGRFHYHQGVFLSGVYQTYLLCKEERYFDYMKGWVDAMMDEEGNIFECDHGQMDDIQPGILLYPLIERTGDMKYRNALETLIEVMRKYPKNREGGFWHKAWFANEMWLDGLYMGGPIQAEYAAKYNAPELFDEVAFQALLMEKVTKDEKTGLLYHAYDSERAAEWADKETGLSPEFWGRSIGWVPVAVLDDLDFLPENHPKRGEMERMVTELLIALCKYQGPDGRWYQVVDKVDAPENWPENSCTCLYVAAICKAVAKGLLNKSYLDCAKKGYEGVINSLSFEEEDIQIGNVCVGTGVGDYQHYINRPTSTNDLHGVGAFLIMCAWAEKYCDEFF